VSNERPIWTGGFADWLTQEPEPGSRTATFARVVQLAAFMAVWASVAVGGGVAGVILGWLPALVLAKVTGMLAGVWRAALAGLVLVVVTGALGAGLVWWAFA
jgi:hypothetical protein